MTKNYLRITVVYAAALLLAQAVNAEEQTLSDYIAYAEENNPALGAAYDAWQAEQARSKQAGALPDPTLNYGYYVESVETRTGPQEWRAGLSQTLPAWGKRGLRAQRAELAAQLAKAKYIRANTALALQVRRAYYELQYLEMAIGKNEETIELLKAFESVAQAGLRTGGQLSDVLKIQIEIGKQENQLHSLRDQRIPLLARFNAVLDRPAETAVSRQDNIEHGAALPDTTQLTDELLRKNPELQALAAEAKMEEKSVSLAKREKAPDITLGIDYIETGDALDPSTPGSGNDPVIATVAVNLPIWVRKNRSAVTEANARRTTALQMKENRENELRADLQLAAFGVRDASRKQELYKKTLIPQANQSFEIALEEYKSGKAGFVDVVDAQRMLLEFELAAVRAQTDEQLHWSEIQMLAGRELGEE